MAEPELLRFQRETKRLVQKIRHRYAASDWAS
jgi:hypothetical protein